MIFATLTIGFMVSIIIITIVFAINHYSKNVTMKYKTKEKDMFAKLENGEISKEEYVEWRKTQEPVYEHSSFELPKTNTSLFNTNDGGIGTIYNGFSPDYGMGHTGTLNDD
jgi:hypothetical protein